MGRFRSSLVFSRNTISRLGRILDMEYKPRELAEEMGVPVDTVYRSWLGGGCPHRKDSKGNVWIPGKPFKVWMVEENEKRKTKVFKLSGEEAWCVSCDSITVIVNPRRKRVKRNVSLVQGMCEHCGGKVNRLERTESDDQPG